MTNLQLANCIVILLVSTTLSTAQDPFAAIVRTTEPLKPTDEQKTFRLPPGFEIQLVASEPDIQKPMNLAFDARGRLWITDSVEYPFAAPAGRKGRDTVKILEDTTDDGHADRIKTFADGLNIPIGIYPHEAIGSNEVSAVVFSIPNIWRLTDTDQDDVADRRTQLYGPFDYSRDTHGLNNSFRRGFDGWLYACHGFNNDSRVQGGDGNQAHMQSGNTYRIRAVNFAQSRIEHFTHGQVNPFGMTFDSFGNQFSADCHSKPIYQLLRGAYYPSFGKPHDGLGFVPPMMNHTHGSTAIAGVTYYSGENFPNEYRGDLFTGNVMTSRVNRNSLEYHGSTIVAKEQPDFLVSTDPWFRPVDVQLGPDGALYIADFYNRIIGHYEVPLDHPQRDRHRGRIWRVVYTGDAKESKPAKMSSLVDRDVGTSVDQCVKALGDENLTKRMLATDMLADGSSELAMDDVLNAYRSDNKFARVHAMWVLYRWAILADDQLASAATDSEPIVRTHAMKVLSEPRRPLGDPIMSDAQRKLAISGLGDKNAFVQRAAADALGRFPTMSSLQPLLDAMSSVAADDHALRHTVRMALRNHFALEGASTHLKTSNLNAKQAHELATAALGYKFQRSSAEPRPVDESADFLIHYLTAYDETDREQLIGFVRRAYNRIQPEHADALADQMQKRFADDFDAQFEVLALIYQGLHLTQSKWSDKVTAWTRRVANGLLDSVEGGFDGWVNTPIPYKVIPFNPWHLEERLSSDGDQDSLFLSTLPGGETGTGKLRSTSFAIPEKLSFYIAGHIGNPRDPVIAMNFVRLHDAKTHDILAESQPPRNDTAQQISWDLKAHAGKNAYLEIVDGDDRRAYAWLAVGRFEPPVIRVPRMSGRVVVDQLSKAFRLANKAEMTELKPRLQKWLLDEMTDMSVRRGAASLLCQFSNQPAHVEGMTPLITDPTLSAEVRERLCHFYVRPSDAEALELLRFATRTSPTDFQNKLARNLSQFRNGGELLLKLIEQGHVSRRFLLEPGVQRRLRELRVKNVDARIITLTAGLKPRSDEVRRLIGTRQFQFAKKQTSRERGAAVFAKSCAACHQLDGKGPVIGPQLDGIGNRGANRIMEDILDPNRNVDVAFHTTSIVTKSGQVKSGLFRREQGEAWILIDNQGKEFTVLKQDIVEQKKINLSLMPENVTQTIPEKDFYDLIAFLMTKRARPAKLPE